jgi:metal-responsive CopG/Arc/MetJ family transcriptional regulator
MRKTTRFTISVPVDLLDAFDRAVVQDDNRSAAVCRLLRSAVKEAKERADVERYIRAYEEQPQTEEEFGWSDQAALASFVELPWE